MKILNDRLREAGRDYAKEQRDAIATKLRHTMALIDEEIKSNFNVYPENGGRLGQRELCRRAGIHYQTLQQPAHKDSTRLEVNDWLDSKEIKTKHTAAKTLTKKADYWHEQHQLVASQIHLYESEFDELKLENSSQKMAFEKQLEKLNSEITRLKQENLILREQAMKSQATGNVTPLQTKRKE